VDAKTRSRYAARANVIKALAHPTRLFVVDELSRTGEHCVCNLTEMIGADISTVSKHLAILKAAGIVEDEKRGSQVYYRLTVNCVEGFLACIENLIQRNVRQRHKLLAGNNVVEAFPAQTNSLISRIASKTFDFPDPLAPRSRFMGPKGNSKFTRVL
jgi:ArsR family transcriptional regulator